MSIVVICLPALCLAGCGARSQSSPTTRRATDVNRELARPAYWYNQPAVASVTGSSFDEVWEACQRAARDRGFRIDRLDYRAGVITTEPLISKQAFEFWRRDVVAPAALAESTLATMRRTVRFEITRNDEDETYEVAPKVLVERFSVAEHRITSVSQYRDVFALTREEALRERDRQRNPLLAQEGIPTSYWYATGRDEALEKRLAESIRGKVTPAGT